MRVLISVTDKTGIVDFARDLSGLGAEIISTGGTARALREAGVPVQDVSDVTKFPEMLDGRVKTMHPAITGGILAMRAKPEHMQAIAEHGIAPIDIVVVNLYQFEKTAAKAGVTLEEMIENIDIGGPTMIRSAAKNWQDVAIVVSPEDYAPIVAELKSGGAITKETKWRLAQRAFSATAEYDMAISATLAQVGAEAATPLPAVLSIRAPKTLGMRYGENPHQSAALYARGTEGVAGAKQLQGKELSYNNLVDLDAAWQLILEFTDPAVAIIKHTNPCGCAQSSSLADAYRRALECDPISAFGGIVGLNRTVDEATAKEMAKLFLEAIAAPDYSPEALAVLGAKRNLRVMKIGPASDNLVVKSISGGYLAQTVDDARLDRANAVVKTKRAPSDEEWRGLEFGWKVVKHVKSNAIVFARDGQLVGVGQGQTSRVDSVKLAGMKAILPLANSVVASDAYFPFPDGLETAVKMGATAFIQPGGSVKDNDVIEAADKLGVAMVFTGVRHFRH